ncbi:MAG: energy-coupling factor ABC transporter ATP-binding protein [bacterium]
MSLFHLENIIHRYPEEKTGRQTVALRIPELSIEHGEFITVVGPNGSGKSTLLELLAFLMRPSEGKIFFETRDAWAESDALSVRRACPILLQKTLLFSCSVHENVMFGLRARGVSKQQAFHQADGSLNLLGISHLAHRRHHELSEGEKRRVALARILALKSEVILLDEPTTSLDQETERLIEGLILRINREQGTTVIMVSHDNQQAMTLSTRIVPLLEGKIATESFRRRSEYVHA